MALLVQLPVTYTDRLRIFEPTSFKQMYSRLTDDRQRLERILL